MTPKEIIIRAMRAIFTDFDVEVARSLVAEDYKHQGVPVPKGAAPILAIIPALQTSGIKLSIHRVIEEGDMVALHVTYEHAQALGSDTLVGFDVFRVADGRVIEHCDTLQPLVTETVSGNGMTDGPTEIVDRDKTQENKALVERFVRDVLQGAAPETVTSYISTTSYTQHNPGVGDGLEGLGAAMAAFAAAGKAMKYERTPIVVAEGNFVFTASEGLLGSTPTAFFDLFRLSDGLIVEHWDAIGPIPEKKPSGSDRA
ncbi:nuclear transport factor 2 family protein [Brevundimonas sp. AJA228-03]|uniref:nuclear transport factor 2 family protein n=1 Tax=Brevundimonas sp. AJA228-03 TaxID=2752515 RepID=UPI001AE06A23|nr:nuclear transport factor 2 family protein [Brevundimonas sp. AJA228-03]QTN18274.1 nuclear transport factor 2 family protein [Brevundimonas sp. AJA228-03]